jgi:hypothetical protein
MQNQNQSLNEIYRKYWDHLSSELQLEKNLNTFAMPLLLKAPELINNENTYKIMIFGQETKGWYDHCSLDRWINIGMDEYERFYLHKNFSKRYGKSSFWQKFRFFEKELSKILKEQNKVPIFIWNNISKIGRSNRRTGVTDDIRSIERKYFPIVSLEIDILKPDLCIFMTGPNRDHDIKFHFQDSIFKKASDQYSIREVARIESEKIKGLRLYHPSYFGGFNNKYKRDIRNLLAEML